MCSAVSLLRRPWPLQGLMHHGGRYRERSGAPSAVWEYASSVESLSTVSLTGYPARFELKKEWKSRRNDRVEII